MPEAPPVQADWWVAGREERTVPDRAWARRPLPRTAKPAARRRPARSVRRMRSGPRGSGRRQARAARGAAGVAAARAVRDGEAAVLAGRPQPGHPGSLKAPAAPAAVRARATRGASAAVPATTSFDTPIKVVLGDVLDDPIGHQVPHRESPAHPVPAVGRRDRKCRNLQQAYVLLG